jgi:hypothetical protein
MHLDTILGNNLQVLHETDKMCTLAGRPPKAEGRKSHVRRTKDTVIIWPKEVDREQTKERRSNGVDRGGAKGTGTARPWQEGLSLSQT